MINKQQTKQINNQKHLMTPLPKGIGISPKVFGVGAIMLFVVLFFVIIMIFHYRGNKHNTEREQYATLVTQTGGITPEAAIAKLNQGISDGVLSTKGMAVPSKNATNLPNTQLIQDTQQQANDLRQAARSNISVVNNYHGPAQQSFSTQQNQVQTTAQPANQLTNMTNALNNLGSISGHKNYQQQNMQNEKGAFLVSHQKKDDQFYLNSKLKKPISPYEIKAGTIIPATLVTGINSDLPGQITARVSRSIYDTVTGNYLLVPQGTTILGIYDNQVAYGQTRVLIVWSRLIFPNGSSFDLKGQPGVDLSGMAGLHDLINNHYVRIFGSAFAFSIFGALGQLSQPKQAANSYPTNAQIIYGAIGQQLTQTGAQLIEKSMNIQPTITIRPGTDFNILLTRDMVLPGSFMN